MEAISSVSNSVFSPEAQTTVYFALLPPLPLTSIVFLLLEINLDHLEYLGLVCMLSCVVKNSDKLYNFTSDPYLVFACVYMFTTEFGYFYLATDIFYFRV